MTAPIPDRLLKIAEVAERIGVSKRTAWALVNGRKIVSLRVGARGVRVLESDLATFVRDARARADR